ncbi:MAG: O-methyltransferase [Clostridia bacterium]|nr:O-methyltransferase [Clostridia bacterium]
MNKVAEYINSFMTFDNPQLPEILKQEQTIKDIHIEPSVGLEVGKFLSLLVRMTNAQRVLELGTCLGYSTIWIAEALRQTGGKLISVEHNVNLYKVTSQNINEAGLSDVVEVIWGDASKVIDQVEGPFDIILQDSGKHLYPVMLEKCINLVRKNGIIIADDALFKPMGFPEEYSEPVHDYNKRVFEDNRLYSTLLPIGHGIVVSTKLCD